MKVEDVKVLVQRANGSCGFQHKRNSDQSYPSENVGQFQHKDGRENLAILPTPKVALSPVLDTKNGKSFHLFITNALNSSIELWSCCNSCDFTFDYWGCLILPGVKKIGGLVVHNAVRDATETHGGLDNFDIFVSCPDLSKIMHIDLQMSEDNGFRCETLTHEYLTKPMDMACTDSGQIATINGVCGRIFLFARELSGDYTLSDILTLSNNAYLSWNSSLCFDSANNILVSNYEKSYLRVHQNNDGISEETIETESELIGLCCLSDGTFLGCNPKSNELMKIKNVGEESVLKPMLGPSKVYCPLHVAASELGGLVIVSGKQRISNQPLVSVFQMKTM